jgi:predicted dehydrogenase
MKFLVAGCGSIGRRHMRNLLASPGVEVYAQDTSAAARKTVSSEFGLTVYEKFDDGLSIEPDAVIIATPTNSHVELALKAVAANCSIFIEKPLSNELAAVPALISEAKRRKIVALVGCNMRFHPGVRKVKELLEDAAIGKVLYADIESGSYLPSWRPTVDHRTIYSSSKAMGGGVILDIIHEIDYALWMLGEVGSVACMAGTLSNLEIETEDTADLLLQFRSGVIGHIHLDYFQRVYSRRCKLAGENGVINWDFTAGQVGFYNASTGSWSYYKQPDNYEINQMYIDELNHFIRCLQGSESPTLDLVGAREDLKVALAAKESAEKNCFVSLKNSL